MRARARADRDGAPRARAARRRDADAIGTVLHQAFSDVAERHGFPSDFPSREYGVGLARALLGAPPYRGVVVERDGAVAGVAFVNVADAVRGIGPVAVSPRVQRTGVGRAVMEAIVEAGAGGEGQRLTQDLFNMASLSLYASLGFVVKEPLLLVQGRPRSVDAAVAGRVRPMGERDLEACAQLCVRVHGVRRTAETAAALNAGLPATVAEREGRVVAYATTLSWWQRGHAVAENLDELILLLRGVAARASDPLTMLVPMRETELHAWCVREGLRAVKPMALMVRGPYREPQGAWLPSVAY